LEEGNQKVIRKLTKISIFCFVFMIIELIGGYFAKSLAIMTDAAHLLSDLSGFVISIISLYIATRPASFELTYGYHRAEVVGALASILIIWVLTVWLVSEAIQRLIVPSEIDALLMLCISVLGLIFNLIMGKILSTEDLPNAFENAEKECFEKVNVDLINNEDLEKSDKDKEKENAVLRATVIHILGMNFITLGDMIQSIGVIIAAVIIYIFQDTIPGIVIVDPICTFVFCIIVLFTTVPLTRDCLNVLMEVTPKEIDIKKLTQELQKVPGVIDLHDIHIWCLSVGKPSISLHILSKTPQKTLELATLVCKSYGVYHITIQVEDFTQRKRQSFIKCSHTVDNTIH
jgi:zinc transporter 2